MLTRALETPFGGAFGDVSFADIDPSDRLAEMDFEMTVALRQANILVSDIGKGPTKWSFKRAGEHVGKRLVKTTQQA